MTLARRISWVLALVAFLALAGAGVTMASRFASAGGNDPAPGAQTCEQQDDADDAAEGATEEADTDDVEEECGDQDAEDADEDEAKVASGQIDDGADLLPQASITLDQAIAAAQAAAGGVLGEIDLEDYQGKLAFNVEIGDQDVKVDATDGSILGMGED